jgi:hypothetical protein
LYYAFEKKKDELMLFMEVEKRAWEGKRSEKFFMLLIVFSCEEKK